MPNSPAVTMASSVSLFLLAASLGLILGVMVR